jgi:hypothetical protein
MKTILNAEIEIDHVRGVIYVHAKGRTVLRICGLPKPIPDLGELGTIDLTHMKSVQYSIPSEELKP